MDPRLEQSPPGAPETLTGSASLEGSRRLLRSQPRRLGFGQPRRVRTPRGYANITIGHRSWPQKPELSTWPGIGTFYLAPTQVLRHLLSPWKARSNYQSRRTAALVTPRRIDASPWRAGSVQRFAYQSSFRPNWICRDVVDVDVITPAVGAGGVDAAENTTVFGVPKFA